MGQRSMSSKRRIEGNEEASRIELLRKLIDLAPSADLRTHDRGTWLLRCTDSRKDRWPVENDLMMPGAMLRNSTPLATDHLSVLFASARECKA